MLKKHNGQGGELWGSECREREEAASVWGKRRGVCVGGEGRGRVIPTFKDSPYGCLLPTSPSLPPSPSPLNQLVDASYNRYAFEDGGKLPAWFAADEAAHFKRAAAHHTGGGGGHQGP
jgi:hypothetical protein